MQAATRPAAVTTPSTYVPYTQPSSVPDAGERGRTMMKSGPFSPAQKRLPPDVAAMRSSPREHSLGAHDSLTSTCAVERKTSHGPGWIPEEGGLVKTGSRAWVPTSA